MSRTALIVVHGVGDQGPNNSAREIAGLLQRANPQAYGEFCECQLELPVGNPFAPDSGFAKVERSVRRSDDTAHAQRPVWYVRSRYARLRSAIERDAAGQADTVAQAAIKSEEEPEDIAFTRRALEDARLTAELSQYRSVKLSGKRAGSEVDIYELYWADLSRLGGWFVRVLAEFYQMLFHVASLGQKTVELAWVNAPQDRGRLKYALIGHALAEWALAVALPVFNLALLFAILPVLLVAAPDSPTARAVLCGLVAAVAIAVAGLAWLWRWSVNTQPPGRLVASLALGVLGLAIVGGTAFGSLALDATTRWPDVVLQLAFSALALAVFLWLVSKLAERRRLPAQRAGGVVEDEWWSAPVAAGALAVAVWVGLLVFGIFFERLELVQNSMRIAEWMFLLIQLAWGALVVSAWLAVAAGTWAAWRSDSWQVKAALWTGKIALVVPGALFYVVNLVAWHVVGFVLKKVVDPQPHEPWLCRPPRYAAPDDWATWTVHDCMDRLLEIGAGGGFNFFMALVMLSMLLLMVGMLHSVIHESRPGMGNDPRASAALGEWLEAGFVLAGVAARVMLVALLVVLPAFWGLDLLGRLPKSPLFEPTLLAVLGGIVIATAGVAVALRAAIFKGLSKGLDIAFDVDNWLKERPVQTNPRGRILLRYLALLEHVRAKGYDRLVIVAHSQGTVITADLLRFLCATRRAPAGLPPITLMTFGSPLRQLYGLRFPHLYGWARDKDVLPSIPDRNRLAVERWINGYRSGDYVGRYLWTAKGPWQPRVGLPAGQGALSFEFCLGAGAHTHYFNATATVVGEVIDLELA